MALRKSGATEQIRLKYSICSNVMLGVARLSSGAAGNGDKRPSAVAALLLLKRNHVTSVPL
jgi:hypothetical protein